MIWKLVIGCTVACGTLLTSLTASAGSVGDFYRGKTITIVVAGGPGGGYGLYARLLSEFMSKQIPGNPKITQQFMPGGGGINATDYVVNIARDDGTVIGMPLSAQATTQAMGLPGVRYDAAKFQWIGRIVDVVQLVTIRRDAGAATISDLQRKTVIAGTTRPGAANYYPFALMNAYLSTRFKIVTGYKGSNGVALAYQRGEVQAQAAPYGTLVVAHPQFLKDVKLTQVALAKDPSLPDVPLLLNLVKSPQQKAVVEFMSAEATIGRAFFLSPGVPKDRVLELRRAFDRTVSEKAFRAMAAKHKMSLNPMGGSHLQRLVAQVLATPAGVVAEAKKVAEGR